MTSLISYTTELRTVNVKTCDPNTYKEMCENFDCYEIIPDDRKVKPYFDIEIKPEYCLEGEEYNDVFKTVCEMAYKQIQNHFVNPEIAILNASSEKYVSCVDGKTKWIISGHIVIHNYKISKKKCLSIVNQMNKDFAKKNEIKDYLEVKDDFKLFDAGVYDPNRKIRSAFANKTHYDKTSNTVIVEDRPMVIEHGTFENSVISNFFDENCTEVEDDTEFKPISPSSSPSPTSITQFPNVSDIDYLLNVCIQSNMCSQGKHKEWVMIGTALKNELGDEAVIPFVNWTNAFGTDNKKNEAFVKITKEIKREKETKTKKVVKIGTIHHWAKHFNSVKYIERFGNKAELILDNDIETAMETGTEYALATYFNTKWGKNFKCIDIKAKAYYAFTDKKIWEDFKDGSKIRQIISNEMTKNFNDYGSSIQKYINNNSCLEEEVKVQFLKKLKLIGEIAIKLGKTNDKDHIVRELSDKIIDTEFEKKLNRLEYFLPIKGGKILNLQTLIPEDRTINHNFSYECNANYIDLTEEQETDIDEYLNQLFCNNQATKKCVINIIKSIFIGKPLRYIYFWTGSGCNGKSLFLKLLNCIFGKFMDTIDTNVILDKKMNNALTTQFKKLDRCRVGYITELKETDKLNETIIKKITGGDAIDFRGLFKDNETINPTCNLMAITNELPNFDVEKAIVNRLIVVPFNNTFPIDISFETKMMAKLDILFSYIIKNGVICDKFDLSEEMLYSKNSYVENNVKEDELEAFIKEFIIVGETEKDCDNKPVYIKNTSFYEMFVSNNPKSRLTKNKITKEIRKFKIETKESNGATTYRNCRWRTEDDNVEE